MLRTTISIQFPTLPANEEQNSQRKLALENAAIGRGQRSVGGGVSGPATGPEVPVIMSQRAGRTDAMAISLASNSRGGIPRPAAGSFSTGSAESRQCRLQGVEATEEGAPFAATEPLDESGHAVLCAVTRLNVDVVPIVGEPEADPTPISAIRVSLDPTTSNQGIGKLGEARKPDPDGASELRGGPVPHREGTKSEELVGGDGFVAFANGNFRPKSPTHGRQRVEEVCRLVCFELNHFVLGIIPMPNNMAAEQPMQASSRVLICIRARTFSGQPGLEMCP